MLILSQENTMIPAGMNHIANYYRFYFYFTVKDSKVSL